MFRSASIGRRVANRFSRGGLRLALLGLALLGLTLCSGCGYPRVSPAAFETAKVVENLCNLQTSAQIPRARALVAEQLEAGEITSDEAGLLAEILDEAEGGDWTAASRQARKLLEAQNQPL